jgi:hypothetical protein
MSIIVELAPEKEKALYEEARRRGVDSHEYARQLIEAHLPDPENIALAHLMQDWIEEDATDEPAEMERRDAEWQELKAGLNANRAAAGERPLFL